MRDLRWSLRARAVRLGTAILQVMRGAAGTGAYERHLAHLARHHPELAPPSRAAFFRADTAARWEGVRRCC